MEVFDLGILCAVGLLTAALSAVVGMAGEGFFKGFDRFVPVALGVIFSAFTEIIDHINQIGKSFIGMEVKDFKDAYRFCLAFDDNFVDIANSVGALEFILGVFADQ